MNIRLTILSVALIATTLIACEFGDRASTDGESPESKPTQLTETGFSEESTSPQNKEEWFSDTRPSQYDIDTIIDDPGVAVRSDDGNAALFVGCDLLFAAIDWPTALLIGSGEVVNTIETFVRGNEVVTYSFDWFGSVLSRKRLVRYEPFLVVISSSSRLNTQDFIREFAKHEYLEVTQGSKSATFSLLGFEDAFGKHCS